jgi:hypothetical protein
MTTRSTLKALTFGAVAVVLGATALPARAYEVETGKMMVCDTQKQVERFVALFEGDAEAAISAVNAEAQDPTACAVLEVAYVSGPQLGIARTRTDAFGIVPIIVVGVKTPAGLQRVSPGGFFTVVKVKEYAV